MNWWQLGLLILGILALAWLLVSAVFGLMVGIIAADIASKVATAKEIYERKHDSKSAEKQP